MSPALPLVQNRTVDLCDLRKLVEKIAVRLGTPRRSLRDCILERELYLRISVTGFCNYHCTFCHNEGGPRTGIISAGFVDMICNAACTVGFRRIQFTGGEPLLVDDIDAYIKIARHYFDDVGITTNGCFLGSRIESLLDAGLSRLHISLHSIRDDPALTRCSEILESLESISQMCSSYGVRPTINVPVPPKDINLARLFLEGLRPRGFSVRLFTILSAADSNLPRSYYYSKLLELAETTNERGSGSDSPAVSVRKFYRPSGLRCTNCPSRDQCNEGSRSLRVGVDTVLRPCLASRAWDISTKHGDLDEILTIASYLALDY